jgi:antitoxin PrlF
MPLVLERVATITEKGQTTIPKPIRDALGVECGGQISFLVDEHGVSLRRVEEGHGDPAIDAFLSFLAKDIEGRPKAIKALSPALARQIAELIEGVEVDPNEEIEGDVSL